MQLPINIVNNNKKYSLQMLQLIKAITLAFFLFWIIKITTAVSFFCHRTKDVYNANEELITDNGNDINFIELEYLEDKYMVESMY